MSSTVGFGRSSTMPLLILLQAACGLALLTSTVIAAVPLAELWTVSGIFLLLHAAIAGLVANSHQPWSSALQRRLRRTLVSYGLGYYGLMTLARFLQLEAADLIDSWANLQWSWRRFLIDWLIGFSVESMMNSIEAFQWPWKLLLRSGWPASLLVLAVTWLPYSLAARWLPGLRTSLEEPESATTVDRPSS